MNKRTVISDVKSIIATAHCNDPTICTSPPVLLLLLPFVFDSGIQVAWLAHPSGMIVVA